MKKMLDMIVRSNEQLNYHNYLLKVSPADNSPLPVMKPGNFVQIEVKDSPNTFLRRPISVNYLDKQKNEMWLLVQDIGEGTHHICQSKENDILNIILPLGNSFTVPINADENCRLLLIGGGVGTAPMLYLGKVLQGQGFDPTFLLGGRSSQDLLQLDDFERTGTVYYTTEDGSKGEKGFVTDHSILQDQHFDYIYTCGPKPMMMAVAKYAHEKNIVCEVSLENLMACGFGACLCCVEKTTKGNLCTCTDGPVFDIKDLLWHN
ncbi:MAG: dihydroorotate dehydrogenase electron transfer subunit [Dysgonamonadaceae bacterium]|jgi:dihydroorotate dehydrogenase electron transfer subunit|nr:dihydroorotate dehydrogenase electron transfer subunit [Dysgonamonadaceae bacterium]MDD3308769.1 dihydroorotate dehydrogenase electron transfer subunit [Dysgonamonadaceae bacterium]MDD3900493.1 dihydroorotate dehydrogenase electron transfer subunit [Dysgonamonadaceae bacterium]MDD4398447.1 dihydroorotate dehydrogenase electron transfer subunit [Dysgonamonadaceae bacterium]MEA5080061.1 dihydroorotate dehydrogenase electron transfer subunit [Dysgonamonadaceae bacterium]